MKMRPLRNSPKPPNIVILNERRLRREMKELGFSCVSTCRRERQDSSPTAQNDNIVAPASYAKVLMKRLLTALCATALCAITLLLPTACDIIKPQTQEKKNEEIEVFRIGVVMDPQKSDFKHLQNDDFFRITYFSFLVYEDVIKLVNANKNPGSIKISDDRRECIVTLPKDVYFHDGSILKADDILYSLNLIKRLSTKHVGVINLEILATLSIEKLSEHKVLLKSERPLHYMRLLNDLLIISQNNNEKLDLNELINNPSGTGPYRFSGVNRGARIVSLERNNRYRLGSPMIKKIEIIAFNNLEDVAMGLITDKLDYAPIFGNIEKETFRYNKKISLFSYIMPYCQTLFLNVNSPKLRDPRVRRALSLLIDRQALVDTNRGLEGIRIPTDTFFNFVHPKTEISVSPPNGEEAKRLFQEAGYEIINGKLLRNGKQLELNISVVDPQSTSYSVEAARVVIKYWENAGISCTISVFQKYLTNEQVPCDNCEVIMLTIMDSPPREFFFSVLSGSTTKGYINIPFSDKQLQTLADNMLPEFEDKYLLKQKLAIQARLKELCPIIPLYYDKGFSALGKRFEDNETIKKQISKDAPYPRYLGLTR